MWVVVVWCVLLYLVILGNFITCELKEKQESDAVEDVQKRECDISSEEIEPEVC